MKKLVLIFLLLFACSAAWATDIYVDGGYGGGDSDGTITKPWTTIANGKTALNALAAGAHNLYIKGGQTYTTSNQTFTVSGTSTSNRVVITPWPGEGNVTIDGAGGSNYQFILSGDYESIRNNGAAVIIFTNGVSGAIRINGDYGEVDGVTITNAAAGGTGVCGIRVYQGASFIISDSTITAYRRGIYAEDGTGTSSNHSTISGNTILAKVYTNASGHGVFLYQNAVPYQYIDITNNSISVDDLATVTPGQTYVGIGGGGTGSGNWTITGNTIYNAGSPLAQSNSNGIILMDTVTATISGNTVYNWGQYGIDVGGSAGMSQGVTVEKNKVYNNGRGNIAVDGVTVGQTTPIIVRNNLSYLSVSPPAGTNYNGGFDFHGDAGVQSPRVQWLNNTCWTNQAHQYARCFWTDANLGSGAMVMKNNIFQCNGTADTKCVQISAALPAGWDIDYNSIYDAGSGKAIRINTTDWANDKLKDAVAGDLCNDLSRMCHGVEGSPSLNNPPTDMSLSSSSSPAYDTGATLTGFSDDYLSVTRPQGNAWDIGAYEYPARTLNLTVAGDGAGTVTSTPAGINSTVTVSENFTDGTSVALVAVPTGDDTITWTCIGGTVSTTTIADDTCTVVMSATRNVTATFGDQPPTQYIVTRSYVGSGTTSPASGDQVVSSPFDGTTTQTPAANWSFSGWSGTCGCTGSGACAPTISSNCTIIATWTENAKNRTLAVTYPTNGEVISSDVCGIMCGLDSQTCSCLWYDASTITLSCTPYTGWYGCTMTGTGCTAGVCTMGADRTVDVTSTDGMRATLGTGASVTVGTGSGTITIGR